MKISIDAALHDGWNRMKTMLFKPFDIVKWLIIGFASFLASLGQGRGFNFNFPSGGQDFGENISDSAKAFENWFAENMIAVILVGLGIFLVVLAVSILILWLSSRGRFVFLSCILNNKAEIRAPWVQYGHLGDKMFWFRLLFGICALVVFALVLGGGFLLLFPYIKAEAFSASFFIILMSIIMLFVVLVFCALTVQVILVDFVAPIMLKKDVAVVPGFGIFYNEFCKGHMWDLTIFYLLRFALSIAAGVIVLIGTCLTCCIAALPYISSVVFLPIAVFIESFTLSYIAQFGDEWDLYTWKTESSPAAAPAHAAPLEQPSTPAQQDGAAPPPDVPPDKPDTEI